MIGKTILHYKILQKLGEGGMGVVYKAEDTKLDRTVAIKFLPRHVAAHKEEKERFVIEAKAAAALNHPNIATIYAIEESEGEAFITMEFIAGQELKDLIKNKPLPVEKVTDIAIQIAKGLQAAHNAGIIHRDIKSSNIMITRDDQIKIMDFGLAKVRGGSLVTKMGTTVGTTAYMSPEQARGEEVDLRADIWSFGIVIYEMLTGQLPFKGDYEQAIVYSMLNEQPEAINNFNPRVNPQLQNIVDRSLQKEKEERYQNASELLKDLNEFKAKNQPKEESPKAIGLKSLKQKIIFGAAILILLVAIVSSIKYLQHDNQQKELATASQAKSQLERLAILPFVNLKSDPETDFLGYALADQIIGALAYVRNISVRPSSAVRKYQNEIPDIATAGHKLQVDYVLTGNYLKQENLVRLNVELVNVNTNELIWREPIEVKYEDAFTLQDIVSKKVLEGLQLQFTSAEQKHIQSDVPQNPLAYEYYLKGISYPYTTQTNQLAVEMLEKSIELDSTFAPAFEALGSRYHRLANYKFGGIRQVELAEKYLHKASSLNPDLLSALGSLALIYTETSKTEEAVELIRKMLKINPNNPEAHFSLGYVYRYVGMSGESEREYDIAISLDPNKRFRSAGITYMYLGKYDKAIQGFDLDPESPYSLSWKGQAYMRQDQQDLALEYLNRAIALDPNSTHGYWAGGMKAFLEGNNIEGIRLSKLWEDKNPTDSEVWYNLSNMYGLLGDKKSCINALKNAVNGGYYNYPFMLKDYFFNSVRDEPEFKEVLTLAEEKHQAFKKKFFSEQM
jgi:serine/threonine protein kinase/tetratricopeptide (TPR) repeat protein